MRFANVDLLATHLDASTHELGHVIPKHADKLTSDGGHPLASNALAAQVSPERSGVARRKPGLPLASGRETGLTDEPPPFGQVLRRPSHLEVINIDD
eukprot:15447841-Alexandrium_andersonii.AAC.1